LRDLNLYALGDILKGCTILGTGGGGSYERGYQTVKRDIENGKIFRLVKLDKVPDDALIASPYYCGAIKPTDAASESKRLEIAEPAPLVAFRALERYMDTKFFAAISTELGGGNTATALSVAANQNISIVDADPAGRSVPELVHTTFYIKGISITPMAVATDIGDVAIVPQVADHGRAEAIARAIAVVSEGRAGVVDHPVSGKNLKSAVIPNALSYAELLGKALRDAQASGENAIEKIAESGNGYILFDGIATTCNWEIKEGFTYGEISLEGKGNYKGRKFKIWYKNENLISWLDGEIYVTAPDLLCVLESITGEPLTNPNGKPGMHLSVVGFPAPEQWRTSKGLEVLSPTYFGFESTYIPIEQQI